MEGETGSSGDIHVEGLRFGFTDVNSPGNHRARYKCHACTTSGLSAGRRENHIRTKHSGMLPKGTGGVVRQTDRQRSTRIQLRAPAVKTPVPDATRRHKTSATPRSSRSSRMDAPSATSSLDSALPADSAAPKLSIGVAASSQPHLSACAGSGSTSVLASSERRPQAERPAIRLAPGTDRRARDRSPSVERLRDDGIKIGAPETSGDDELEHAGPEIPDQPQDDEDVTDDEEDYNWINGIPASQVASPQIDMPERVEDPTLSGWGLAIIMPQRVFLCDECGVCVPPCRLERHVKEHKIAKIGKKLIDTWIAKHGLDPDGVPPKPTILRRSIPGLKVIDAWQCTDPTCGKLLGTESVRDNHRHAPVARQRLATWYAPTMGNGGGYVKVVEDDAMEAVGAAEEDVVARIWDELEGTDGTFDTAFASTEDPRKTHPFLVVSGWGKVLAQWDKMKFEKLKSWCSSEREMVNACEALLLWAVQKMTDRNVDVRTEIGTCFGTSTHANCKIFRPPETHDTIRRYASTMASFLSFVGNGLPGKDDSPPVFVVTDSQATAVAELQCALNDPEATAEDRRNAVQAAMYELVADELPIAEDSWHPLSLFVIVCNTQPGKIAAPPENVTPKLADIQYSCRAVVWAEMLRRRETEGGRLMAIAKEEGKWLKMGEDTPFRALKSTSTLAAYFAQQVSRPPRFRWGRQDSYFSYEGHRMQVDDLRRLPGEAVKRADEAFARVLDYLGESRDATLDPGWIKDNNDNRNINHWFRTDNPDMDTRGKEMRRRVYQRGLFTEDRGGKIVVKHTAIADFLRLMDELTRAIAVAIYLGTGQPARGPELLGILYRNIQGRLRNLFGMDDLLVIVNYVNKTTSVHMADKPIPRGLPDCLSFLLLNLLAYLRPLQMALRKQMPNYTTETDRLLATQVFIVADAQLGTAGLTEGLKALTAAILGCEGGYGVEDCRQILIGAGRHLYDRVVMMKKGMDDVFDLQSGHSSDVGRRWYGVHEEKISTAMPDWVQEAFLQLSSEHHRAFLLDSMRLAGMRQLSAEEQELRTRLYRKPSLFSSDMGAAPVLEGLDFLGQKIERMTLELQKIRGESSRQQRDSAPVATSSILDLMGDQVAAAMAAHRAEYVGYRDSDLVMPRHVDWKPEVLNGLRSLHKGGYFLSNAQATATMIAASRREHLIATIPTGGGKSEVWMVPAKMEAASKLVTVVIVPLTTLREDVIKRCREKGINSGTWMGGAGSREVNVMVVTPETASSARFAEWLKELRTEGRLARIVGDEVQYYVTHTKFRPCIEGLFWTLGALSVPLLFLSGSLPPKLERQVVAMTGLTTFRTVRDHTTRLNIKQSRVICDVGGPSQNDHMVAIARAMKEKMAKEQPNFKGLRMIYIPTVSQTHTWREAFEIAVREDPRPIVQQLAGGVVYANAQMDEKAREEALRRWKVGGDAHTIVCTEYLSLGFDRAGVTTVWHAGEAPSALDYVQQMGRAARKVGELGHAVLFVAGQRVGAGPTADGRHVMSELATTGGCLRAVLDAFNDGQSTPCYAWPEGTQWCDSCVSKVNAAPSHRAVVPALERAFDAVEQPVERQTHQGNQWEATHVATAGMDVDEAPFSASLPPGRADVVVDEVSAPQIIERRALRPPVVPNTPGPVGPMAPAKPVALGGMPPFTLSSTPSSGSRRTSDPSSLGHAGLLMPTAHGVKLNAAQRPVNPPSGIEWKRTRESCLKGYAGIISDICNRLGDGCGPCALVGRRASHARLIDCPVLRSPKTSHTDAYETVRAYLDLRSEVGDKIAGKKGGPGQARAGAELEWKGLCITCWLPQWTSTGDAHSWPQSNSVGPPGSKTDNKPICKFKGQGISEIVATIGRHPSWAHVRDEAAKHFKMGESCDWPQFKEWVLGSDGDGAAGLRALDLVRWAMAFLHINAASTGVLA